MTDLRIVMLSSDRSIADASSRAHKRIKEYTDRVASFVVVIPGGHERRRHDSSIVRSVPNALAYLRAAKEEARAAARKGRTIVTAQDPFEIGVVGMLAARAAKVPLHVQVHIDFYDPYFRKESPRQRFQSMLAPYVLKRAAGIRTVSPRIEKYLVDTLGIPEDRVECLPIAADVAELLTYPRPPKQGNMDILAASRFVKQKDVPLLVRAFARVSSAHPDVRLTLIGRGPEEKRIRAAVAATAVADRVSIEPWSDALPERIAAASIFALSSDYEGWGMTVVEAAALGTPVLMTDVGCAGSIIVDGESGLVVPVRDETAFTDALGRLLDDAALRARLSAAGPEAARKVIAGLAYDDAVIAGWEAATKAV